MSSSMSDNSLHAQRNVRRTSARRPTHDAINICCVNFSLFLYSRVVANADAHDVCVTSLPRGPVRTRARSAVPPGDAPIVQLQHGATQWQQRRRVEKRRPRRKAEERPPSGRPPRRKPPASAVNAVAVEKESRLRAGFLVSIGNHEQSSTRIARARKLDDPVYQRRVFDSLLLRGSRKLALLLQVAIRIYFDHVDLSRLRDA